MFSRFKKSLLTTILLGCSYTALAEVSRIEISQRSTLEGGNSDLSYESVSGTLHYTLDPNDSANRLIVDIENAPLNSRGLVAFTSDFELLIPKGEIASDTLIYYVNNRGRATLPPERDINNPLSQYGHTYLVSGWINELTPNPSSSQLRAPVVGETGAPITGDVRYEVVVNSDANDVNIAGGTHLAYAPTQSGLNNATLSHRTNQSDPRQVISSDQFSLSVEPVEGSTQYLVRLHLQGGLKAGEIYELIYEAKDPVLSGAGLAGIRDAVSLLRYGSDDQALNAQVASLGLPALNNSVSWGVSQSGRLLRQFLYQGFNADLEGRPVFDGVMPVIAGGGFGMFNVRFAMPTRTNGQHENHLYPNDYFPFTYGDSTNPFTGKTDGILRHARQTNTEPKVMHIQTSNEYWIRAGSLVHTDPLGTSDAPIPSNVRIYAIGGSQHGSGSGTAAPARSGQLPSNPNRWTPISETLLQALVEWVAESKEPPASRYPKIADDSLVPSHLSDDSINPSAWRILPNSPYPKAMYQVAHVSFGESFLEEGIIGAHPTGAEQFFRALVPAVNTDNNDSALTTVLPPLTQVPLATFVPWNIRAVDSGASTELARLTGGYIPFSLTAEIANQTGDFRASIEERYDSFQEYLQQYETATDRLIAEGFLLPGYKEEYMKLGEASETLFN